MKHAALLLVFALAVHFAWCYAPLSVRSAIKKFLGRHLPWLLLIVGSLFAALVGAFYSRSVNIL